LEQLKIPPDSIKLVFLNGVHANGDEILKDGDRIGAFPPIGGGKGADAFRFCPSRNLEYQPPIRAYYLLQDVGFRASSFSSAGARLRP
jgi:hypothetical protein